MIRQREQSLETHETEFFVRMGNALGFEVGYLPSAIFGHKVCTLRTHKRRLVRRALWLGYLKRALERLDSKRTRAKNGRCPRQLLNISVQQCVAQLVRRPDLTGLTQLVSLGVLTFSVGLGYFYGVLRW
jgi:hypothetical protein